MSSFAAAVAPLPLREMSHWNLFRSFIGLGASSYVVYGMEDFGAVIPASAGVANPNDDVFEDNESSLVFECFSLNILRPDYSYTVLTLVSVHGLSIPRNRTSHKPPLLSNGRLL